MYNRFTEKSSSNLFFIKKTFQWIFLYEKQSNEEIQFLRFKKQEKQIFLLLFLFVA